MYILDVGEQNYLRWLYLRLVLMKEVLSNRGTMYVHIDWHIGHYVKILLDEIFGKDNLVNEIIWSYRTGGVPEKGFAKKHDVIYYYKKSEKYYFNTLKEKTFIPTLANRTFAKEKLGAEIDNEGCPVCGLKGQWYKMSIMRDVWDITPLFRNSQERVNYFTQKPSEILERIINASCPKDGIAADFFCGSGTTGAVAEKLGRRWIMSDINEMACKISKERLERLVKIKY